MQLDFGRGLAPFQMFKGFGLDLGGRALKGLRVEGMYGLLRDTQFGSDFRVRCRFLSDAVWTRNLSQARFQGCSGLT